MNQQRNDSAGSSIPQIWRSLEERVDAPEFREMIAREFPDEADVFTDPVSRRRFLMLAGASLGLAGLAGCYKPPRETIVPYVNQPEQLVLGKPNYYATAIPMSGSAIGVLVESHEGRPTKVEGNPDHPLSGGATDIFAQASVLNLYDPDRSQEVVYRSHPRTWEEAFREIMKRLVESTAGEKGKQPVLRILTDAVGSPTLREQLHAVLKRYPQSQWVEWEPALTFSEAESTACELVFGKPYAVHYDLKKANVVLTLDSDLLGSGPEHLKYARDFVSRRRVLPSAHGKHDEEKKEGEGHAGKLEDWNRLYAVESTPTPTGMFADNRLALSPVLVEAFARKVAEALELLPATADLPEHDPGQNQATPRRWWIDEVVKELRDEKNKGKSVVVAGEGAPPNVHALALAINDKLGNIGSTVLLTELPASESQKGIKALQTLTEEMANGKVDVLLIIGPNPVHSAPVDVQFATALKRVPFTLHHSLYVDETSVACQWHLPQTHYLESWGDVVAHDGTASIIQPLIAPLYHGKPPIELLSALLDEVPRTAYDLVRSYWQKQAGITEGSVPPPKFENVWTRAVHDGKIPEELAKAPKPAEGVKDSGKWKANFQKTEPSTDGKELTLSFRLDPTLYDGRFANNGWLQEVPKPVTKLTWGNAALISPQTAKDLGVSQKLGGHGGNYGELITDIIELKYRGLPALKVPAYVQPGQPDGVVTVHLGHGRDKAGRVGNDYGFNAAKLWTSTAPLSGNQLEIRVTREKFTLACTQVLWTMGPKEMGPKERGSTEQVTYRGILRFGTKDEYNGVDPKEPEGKDPKDVVLKFEHMSKEKKEEEKKLTESDKKKRRIALSMFASQSDVDDQKDANGNDLANPTYWDNKHQWGMVIDLGACMGCSACVVACQAENNISVVGKDQVTRGRAMHWLRIDRYFLGDVNELVQAYTQPVPCMQCENAPCELVCPVEATSHSPDGLNDMTYNRCVGTRYCANNCPYKVRRFNFLEFADYSTKSLFGVRNPDVTVRTRGVMEKCTYCVQRIRVAGIEARNQGRDIKDGEIVTACEAACPTQAITFGNIKDKTSRVHHLKETPVNYEVLEELNTRPRTSYLAALKNPNANLRS